MISETTDTGQLSIPLGTDAIWAEVADAEDKRSVDAVQEQAPSTAVYTLVPLEQWRQEQTAQPDAAVNEVLQEGHLYEIDGGVFKAKQQDECWELWVWQGHNGKDVGTRNGFEVSASGGLHDRLYVVETGETLVLAHARFAVAGLRHVDAPLVENVSGEKNSNVSRQTGQGY